MPLKISFLKKPGKDTIINENTKYFSILILTLFRMGLFGAARGLGRGGGAKSSPLSKICLTYPTIMKLGTVIP